MTPEFDGNEQALAGRSLDLVWMLIDEVDKAFKCEAKAMSGTELVGLSEVTNSALRTAWPFVAKKLETIRPARDGA